MNEATASCRAPLSGLCLNRFHPLVAHSAGGCAFFGTKLGRYIHWSIAHQNSYNPKSAHEWHRSAEQPTRESGNTVDWGKHDCWLALLGVAGVNQHHSCHFLWEACCEDSHV